MSAEQQARDMLERMGVENAQSWSAGEVVELANLIADRHRPAVPADVEAMCERLLEGATVLDTPFHHIAIAADMEKAAAMLRSLSKDAERYREARHMGIHSYGIPRYRQDADISVDAALAAKEQP